MQEVVNDFSFPSLDLKELWADQVMTELPYELTGAQKRTLLEIRKDLRGKKVMQRLVQGDVGSGKTIIAFLSMLDAAQAGCADGSHGSLGDAALPELYGIV